MLGGSRDCFHLLPNAQPGFGHSYERICKSGRKFLSWHFRGVRCQETYKAAEAVGAEKVQFPCRNDAPPRSCRRAGTPASPLLPATSAVARRIGGRGQVFGAPHSLIIEDRMATAKKANARYFFIEVLDAILLLRVTGHGFESHDVVTAVDVKGFTGNARAGV